MDWWNVTIALAVAWATIGGLWRPGSIALALAWVIGEAVTTASGNSLPISLYWVLDPFVLYTIWRFRAGVLDMSIMAVFPFQWATYVMANGAEQWWLLFWLALAQMVLAGPWPALQKAGAWVSHGPLRTGKRAHEVR